MCRLRPLLLLPCFICVFLTANAANAQGPTTLQLGTPIERSLGPNQVQEFIINLEENTLIQFVVEQRGIDVIVKVASPSGKSLGQFDSSNGDDGPEHVSFVAVAPGAYRVAVSVLDPSDPTTGRFEIKILELRQATEQEIKDSKSQELAKAKGVALLRELDGLIGEIKSPFTRIKAQLQIAPLLWSSDEKRAAKYFSDATNGFKEYLASLDASSDEYAQQYQGITQLRSEIIDLLAPRDPDAALSFLYSTVPQPSPYTSRRDSDSQETTLEVSIANEFLRTDANRALQIARRILKSRYSSNLLSTISLLRQQNPELAGQFANEIAGKLLTDKLLTKPDAANLAIGLLRSSPGPAIRGQPVNANGLQPPTPVLPEAQYRELLQKAITEALSYDEQRPRNYTPERDVEWTLLNGLQQLGADVDSVMSGGVAAVQKKLAELSNQQTTTVQHYQNEIANNSADAALGVIEEAPANQREQLYIQLAGREANNGDFARAREIINERVSNPFQRRHSLRNVEQQEVYRAISAGKVEEALRIISMWRNPRDRANYLSQIMNQIGPGRKRANAMNLLEQVKTLLGASPQAQDQDQMNALFELARAFAKYDTKRSFEILDPLVEQFNEICAAARTMDGFGSENYEDDELNMQNGNTVAQIVEHMSNVVGTLALTNFERARATSERIKLPEVRLKIYLDIAQQTIQGTDLNR
ncbi:MAG TPA: hypothetical protein VF088_06845 [Pyrinomonadaceae bacterium]